MKEIADLNAKIFGKKDPYSQESIYTKAVKKIVRKHRGNIVGYLLYSVSEEQIDLLRIGTHDKHRKKGLAMSMMRSLKRIARKHQKPCRTYLAYDNIPSYLLHTKAGFVPTHIAWNQWVWVEYKQEA